MLQRSGLELEVFHIVINDLEVKINNILKLTDDTNSKGIINT